MIFNTSVILRVKVEMEGRREIILVQQTDASAREYAVALTDLGFPALVCASLHGFKRLHHPRRLLATVLVGPSTQVEPTVTGLRRLDPRMWLVWINGAASGALRTTVLAAGVDVCFEGVTRPVDLCASVQALYHRNQRLKRSDDTRQRLSERERLAAGAKHNVGHSKLFASVATALPQASRPVVDASPTVARVATWASALSSDLDVAPAWALVDGGRRLRSPRGNFIALTAAERIFMRQLMAAQGLPIHREALAIRHTDGAVRLQRSADVVASRLRIKCRRHGEELPVLSIRGWGYMMAPPERHPTPSHGA